MNEDRQVGTADIRIYDRTAPAPKKQRRPLKSYWNGRTKRVFKFLFILVACFFCLRGVNACNSSIREYEAERIALMDRELERFGKEVLIIDIFRDSRHSHPQHDYAIVENARGERKRVLLNYKPAIKGDTWAITHDDDHFMLDRQPKKPTTQ